MSVKLLSHHMKLYLLFPHKYPATSAKLNAHETPLRLALYPFSTTFREALREAIEEVVPNEV